MPAAFLQCDSSAVYQATRPQSMQGEVILDKRGTGWKGEKKVKKEKKEEEEEKVVRWV